MDILEKCEKLNYFIVSTDHSNYLFASFNKSISLFSLDEMFLDPVRKIRGLNKHEESSYIRNALCKYGIRLIETNNFYPPGKLDNLKEDYLIINIAGLA